MNDTMSEQNPRVTIFGFNMYLRSIRSSVHRPKMAMAALRLAGASLEAPWGPLEFYWVPQKLPLLFRQCHRSRFVVVGVVAL